jgi:mevalonate kinase
MREDLSASVTLEIPAKVMLAGEYALLAAEGCGLALAVAPGFKVQAEFATRWAISLPDLGLALSGETLEAINRESEAIRYVATTLELAAQRFPQLKPISVSLQSVPGRVPVGASASLVTGTLLAAARLAGAADSAEALTELAITAHRVTQGSGSGYDVATILQGGAVRLYAGPQDSPLTVCSDSLYPGVTVIAARAGEAAPTGPLVAAVLHKTSSDPEMGLALRRHVRSSSTLVEALCNGPDWPTVVTACEEANHTLELLDRGVGGAILANPIRAAIAAGRPAPVRVSGAGGGDLVVGLAPNPDQGQKLLEQWRAAGFDSWLLEPSPIR